MSRWVWYRMLGGGSGSSSRGATERSQPADLAAAPGQLLCGDLWQGWAGRMGLLPGVVLAADSRRQHALQHGDLKRMLWSVACRPVEIVMPAADLCGIMPGHHCLRSKDGARHLRGWLCRLQDCCKLSHLPSRLGSPTEGPLGVQQQPSCSTSPCVMPGVVCQ